jgi:hypothetical protein
MEKGMNCYFKIFPVVAIAVLAISLFSIAVPFVSGHYGVSVDVETCQALDFSSDLKFTYNIGEPVYARGLTQNFSQTLNIYLVPDTTWDQINGQEIPDRIPGTVETVTTNSEGKFGPLTIWDHAQPGKYDICIDTNNNGRYNPEKDAVWDSQVQITAGFFVLPEYPFGALIALTACFAALAVYKKKFSQI